MEKMLRLLCLLMLLHPIAADGECDVSINTINCKYRHLTDVPDFPFTSNCEIVYLNFNAIYTIPANAFANVSNTSELHLYLDHNNVSFIHEDAFRDLENVTVRLFVQQNNPAIKSSLFKALKVLTSLTHLRLDGIDTLDGLPVSTVNETLEYMSLGLDSLTVWPDQLQGLSHLHTLIVSDIRQPMCIPNDAFNGLEQSLEFLEIKDSVIDARLDAICTLSNLQTLTLDFVKLNDSNVTFPQCTNTLDSTWLLSLRFVSFPTTSIPKFFDTFPNITSLEISFNPELQQISEDLIPQQNTVTHLNLMHNKFRQIPFAIQKMKHLEILDLSHNLISEIESNDLGNIPKLRRLVINNNPIVVISDHAFSGLPSLAFIDISYLHLDSVPEVLKYAGNLTSLNLHGNPLICHCKMLWLVSTPVIKSAKASCSKTNQLDVDIVEFLNSNCKHVP